MNTENPLEASARIASARVLSGISALAAILFFMVGGIACLGGSPESEDDLANDPQWRAERITVLEEAIDRDHARLQDLISQPKQLDDWTLHDNPEIRAIAGRLTRHVHELDRLKAVESEMAVAK
jgi:hypothetical protein